MALFMIAGKAGASDLKVMVRDTVPEVKSDTLSPEMVDTISVPEEEQELEEEVEERELNKPDENNEEKRRKSSKSFVNFDIGVNNYLQNGKFPDATDEQFTIKPFGSWYVALASVHRNTIAGPLYLETGGSLSWYNFKFQDAMTRLDKDTDQTLFIQDPNGFNEYIKSKLTVSYINVFLMPGLHLGKDSKGRPAWKHNQDKGVRIAVGPYAGYRIGSYTKVVFDNGAKQKDRTRNNYYLSNLRYGIRAQLGWNGTDLFFNYDMNTLFEEGKGPELNPFSFGIIF